MRGLALALVFVLIGCTMPRPDAEAGTYANPVLDEDFPDPSVLAEPDGWYYVYATQGEHDGRMLNIQLARSTDLVRWERLDDALPVKPVWAASTQDFWAPHVSRHDGRYYAYYSARPDPAPGAPEPGLCLAVAMADRPQGPFTDIGRPLLCGNGFEAIDPFAYDDPATGRRLLYWGSGFGPIKVQELGPDRVSFAPGTQPLALVHPVTDGGPDDYQRLVEAASILRHDGWYYLFYSGNNCCGPEARYAVMVARSRNATGPFATRAAATGSADSVILKLGRRWIAPGHSSIATDAKGTHWLLYHAIDSRRPSARQGDGTNTRRVLLLDRLVWRDGWPEIAGGTPSDDLRPAPVAR